MLLLAGLLYGLLPASGLAQRATKIRAHDGATNDFFGSAVAVDGDVAVIGARDRDEQAYNSGAAYVFERHEVLGWQVAAKLVPPEGDEGDQFGTAVAIEGARLLVGAPGDDDARPHAGAVYAYRREADGWTLAGKLYAEDAEGALFGSAVALFGDRAVIGAPSYEQGTAYVFDYEDGMWRQQARLAPADLPPRLSYGRTVALHGDVALVGTWRDPHDPPVVGRAYVFVREGETWREAQILVPSDGTEEDFFGASVAVSGDYALVGAYKAETPSKDAGAAYVFHRTADGWAEQAKLIAADAYVEDLLGWSVALQGDLALVGSPREDEAARTAGAAYLFRRTGTAWAQTAKIMARDAEEDDFFGYTVTLSGSQLAIGAVGDDDRASIAGAAYLYDLPLDFSTPGAGERPIGTEAPSGVPAPALGPAYPNPTRRRTTIAFTLPAAQRATLAAYDLLGRHVATLAEGRHAPGRHEATFDAAGLPAGLYLLHLDTGGAQEIRRLVVAR